MQSGRVYHRPLLLLREHRSPSTRDEASPSYLGSVATASHKLTWRTLLDYILCTEKQLPDTRWSYSYTLRRMPASITSTSSHLNPFFGPHHLKNNRADGAYKWSARFDAHIYQFDPAAIDQVSEFLG